MYSFTVPSLPHLSDQLTLLVVMVVSFYSQQLLGILNSNKLLADEILHIFHIGSSMKWIKVSPGLLPLCNSLKKMNCGRWWAHASFSTWRPGLSLIALSHEEVCKCCNAQEQYFGLSLCWDWMVIECAFGRLKARFGALRRTMELNPSDLPLLIYACFVLHNYCEACKETVDDSRVMTAMQINQESKPPMQNNCYWTETQGKSEGW